MYLHSVLLSGFKTFPVRTYIKFHPGITSIVGPNGSGKSNIVDGILWAMGEGRGSLLRASRMEDVIFKGSSSRAPLSRAEVVLNFAEGEESISIGRRVYRDGESDFLINGAMVRLRDLQDKLREIGIEAREYVVIEQGQVEALLSMEPAERMVFLEALAGVSMYRERIKEALRTLERVKERLQLLEARQREIEENYSKVKGELDLLLRYRALTSQLEKLYSSLLIKKRMSLLLSMEKLQQEEKSLQEKLSKIAFQTSELLQRARKLSEEKAILMEKIKDLEAEKAELKGKEAELRPKIYSLTEEVTKLSERKENYRRKLEEANRRLESLKERLERAKVRLQEEKERYLRLQRKHRQAQEEEKKEEEALQGERRAYISLLSEYQKRRALKEERERRLTRALEERKNLERELSRLREEALPPPQDLEPLEARWKLLQEEKERLTSALSVKRERLKQVRRTIEVLQKALKGKESRKIKIKQEYSDLAELLWERELRARPLENPEELEPGLYLLEREWPEGEFKAVAGAEVPFRDALWRENLPQAIEAWRREGRAVVFPEGVIYPEGVLRIKGKDRGSLSLLLELERLKAEEAELARAIQREGQREENLVQELSELKTRLKEARHQEERRKRLREERERKLKKIQERLSALQEEIEEHLPEEELPEKEVEKMETLLREREKELREGEKRLSVLRKRASEAASELRLCNREIVRLEEEIRRGEKDKERLLSEISEMERRIQKNLRSLHENREILEELKGREREIEGKIGKIEERISHLLQENSRVEEQGRSLDRKLGKLHREELRLKDKAGEIKGEMERLRERLEALKKEAKERVGRPLLSLKDHYDLPPEELQSKIARLEEERSSLGDINFKAEREEAEIRRQLEEILEQKQDLLQAMETARETARSLERAYHRRIREAFERLAHEYSSVFSSVAEGEVLLKMEEGLNISVRFKGKKFQPLSMLSGGERALASLLFYISLFRIKPAPFLILDEVDAPLDLPNLTKLISLVKELKKSTQIIMITHNPTTARNADYIYGISMPEDGTSRVYSVRAEELFNHGR